MSLTKYMLRCQTCATMESFIHLSLMLFKNRTTNMFHTLRRSLTLTVLSLGGTSSFPIEAEMRMYSI